MLPPGGRKREVDIREVLNAIFYILLEGVRWRSLPGDFPPWQTVYTYFRNWRKNGVWVKIHDSLREWVRIEQERHPSPSEAIIDSHRACKDSLGRSTSALVPEDEEQLKSDVLSCFNLLTRGQF